jgi:flavin reductase (DIM6/NTAB) family NADH-FMN oxidoreductase RutF
VGALPLYGAALLPGALATIECRTHQRIDAGDHTILIGVVEVVRVGESDGRPLGHHRGRYFQLT